MHPFLSILPCPFFHFSCLNPGLSKKKDRAYFLASLASSVWLYLAHNVAYCFAGVAFIDLYTPLIKDCGPVPWADNGTSACKLCAPSCKVRCCSIMTCFCSIFSLFLLHMTRFCSISDRLYGQGLSVHYLHAGYEIIAGIIAKAAGLM